MAVIFSEVPADFGSVFGELIYVVEGVEAGQTATVELYLADGEQPVGAKVVRGGVSHPNRWRPSGRVS